MVPSTARPVSSLEVQVISAPDFALPFTESVKLEVLICLPAVIGINGFASPTANTLDDAGIFSAVTLTSSTLKSLINK